MQYEELSEAISKMKLGKVPGKDNKSSEIRKYLYVIEKRKEKLNKLMHEIIQEIKLTKEWIKQKKDKRDCNNYKCHTLPNIPGKLLAKIMGEKN